MVGAVTWVNYDEVAPTYDQRYISGGPQGIASALLDLAYDAGGGRVLEVGCGTGHWLATVAPAVSVAIGLDLSPRMLEKAGLRQEDLHLVLGRAGELAFAHGAFGLVYCVNALHHFGRPLAFVREARRLLRPGGTLGIIGMDPHQGRDRWYLYDYFTGTYERDLQRCPSMATVVGWMTGSDFERVHWRDVGRITATKVGRAVLDDPFLLKHSVSQLALLTQDAYAAGIAQIETDLARAEAAGEVIEFSVDLSLFLISGHAGQDPLVEL